MAITTKDIAKMANVSQSTVSRCLNDSPMISEKTKKKVLKIAEEHGFQFNANARSLSAKKTNTIGVILPKSLFISGEVHFRSWQNELIESLERMEFDVIVSFFENRFTKQNNIKRLIAAKKIDGLIILEPSLNDETIAILEKTDIPYIFCKYLPPFYKTREVDFVCVDQYKGGYIAADHLIKNGHKKIMCISANHIGGEFGLRTEGFKAALHDYSLPYHDKMLFYGDATFDSGYRVIKDNVDVLRDFTSIFAQNDLMALGAIKALRELDIYVPQDIAVVGFDDIELSTLYKPYLTTVQQPTKEIAALTCKRLIDKLNSSETMKQKLEISPTLVIRESCGISY
ncbi:MULTISPECIES: LacI family DNA-binding transcriptional regulator [Peribacillus]|uniref:LacI family DNA-binding transcriptional regulator n=2 Tax=Peribacillus castrilensis TaxID=2897690 RepID=A0AAW9NE69_9BACI|nr:LacI family DNA-binding transcriptional regulator [Peribacillus frigoritolerans]KOR77080.1 LacI family transcriptional regulator [Bacillus sp. FJAT-21352]KOR85683.1 LacI family transcriptional regulator [Bacillus sp. FJAT-22058]MEC0274444.1 LacI family DNA-binding transcriptional regulator [Peribacillus castrilensis]AZV61641.1 LacI family transcriptional regulator [Peribacillus frigoritolerans]MED4691576.1 LacI family DNA-binding transcriptional regulator [Peribacillus frigoritolerans]